MISISYNWHGNFDARATVCAVSDRFFLAHAHFRQISTSRGSSGDGFQITDPHFIFIFNSESRNGHGTDR